MNKVRLIFALAALFLLSSSTPILAYSLNISIDQNGLIRYRLPSVLGDEDKPDEPKKEEKKAEKPEDKPDEPIKEEKKSENTRKVEIKKDNTTTKVTITRDDNTQFTLQPEKLKLQFPVSPAPQSPKPTSEIEEESSSESEDENNNNNRRDRSDESVEIQSETHDDGTVEFQLESGNVKAKIKNNEIEVNVKNKHIGITDVQGNIIELNYLPDQVEQKMLDLGLSSVPGSLEVSPSGDRFVYTADTIQQQKLFGIIPRKVTYHVQFDDETGIATKSAVSQNLIQQLLNLFSF